MLVISASKGQVRTLVNVRNEEEERSLEVCKAFESLAARYAGRHFVYREGRYTLIIAELLRVQTDVTGVDIWFRISARNGVVFLPPAPLVCDTAVDNSMGVRLSWDSFYFDQFRWSEPYLGVKMFFCDEIVADLEHEARVVANFSAEERFRRLDELLFEDVRRLDPQLAGRKRQKQAVQ